MFVHLIRQQNKIVSLCLLKKKAKRFLSLLVYCGVSIHSFRLRSIPLWVLRGACVENNFQFFFSHYFKRAVTKSSIINTDGFFPLIFTYIKQSWRFIFAQKDFIKSFLFSSFSLIHFEIDSVIQINKMLWIEQRKWKR